MHTASIVLNGVVVQFNLSPKGSPEGFMLRDADNGIVQINFEPDLAGSVTVAISEGDFVSAEANPSADRHPDAGPVFELRTVTVPGGKTVVAVGPGKEEITVRGKVVRLNHARRGEINGAILDTSDFVHLRPHGVRAVGGLVIGQCVEATGEVRPGWANHRVIEARTANGIDISHPPKKVHEPKHAPKAKAAAKH